MASSSSCWHLIFSQFFSCWENTAVRHAPQLFTNICPSYVSYVNAATLNLVFVPSFTDSRGNFCLYLHLFTQTCLDKPRCTHKHKLTSLPFPSQSVICAWSPGGCREGVSTYLIALTWYKRMSPLYPDRLTASFLSCTCRCGRMSSLSTDLYIVYILKIFCILFYFIFFIFKLPSLF